MFKTPIKLSQIINSSIDILLSFFILIFKNIFMKNYLNFENEIKELESEIDNLKDPYNQSGLSEIDTRKISETQNEIDEKLKALYSNLDPWQTTMVARHEDRPKSKFFIENLFEDFVPLSGDRYYGEDESVLAGFGKFNGKSVLVIGERSCFFS